MSDEPEGLTTMATEYVYVVRTGGAYKIGRTTNLERRLVTLQTAVPSRVQLVRSWKTDHGRKLERYLQWRFADHHIGGEWFRLSPAQMEDLKALPDVPSLEHEALEDLRMRRIRRTRRKPVPCLRCGYTWIPYGRGRPQRCANVECRSPYWDQPRQRKPPSKEGPEEEAP